MLDDVRHSNNGSISKLGAPHVGESSATDCEHPCKGGLCSVNVSWCYWAQTKCCHAMHRVWSKNVGDG